MTLDEAEEKLLAFGEQWHKSWEESWEVSFEYVFEYPLEIRKIIYMTNIIEGLNRQ